MNVPNSLSLARLLAVPLIVWLILVEAWGWAMALFLAAGVTDAIDGWIAKRFNMRTELGAYLDPLADKVLLVCIYVLLSVQGHLPLWLTILVVSRDLLIVGGVLLSYAMGISLAIRPLWVSKANTFAQIGLAFFALLLLAVPALDGLAVIYEAMVYAVATTTVLSGAQYVIEWARDQGQDTQNPTG